MTNVSNVPSVAAHWWKKHLQPRMIYCCAPNATPTIILPNATTARKPSCQVCLRTIVSPPSNSSLQGERQQTDGVKHSLGAKWQEWTKQSWVDPGNITGKAQKAALFIRTETRRGGQRQAEKIPWIYTKKVLRESQTVGQRGSKSGLRLWRLHIWERKPVRKFYWQFLMNRLLTGYLKY